MQYQIFIFMMAFLNADLNQEKKKNERNLLGIELAIGAGALGLVEILRRQEYVFNWEDDRIWEQRFQQLYQEFNMSEVKEEKEKVKKFAENQKMIKKILNLVLDTYAGNAQGICHRIFKIQYETKVMRINQQFNDLFSKNGRITKYKITDNVKNMNEAMPLNLLKKMKELKTQEKQEREILDDNWVLCSDFVQFIQDNKMYTKHMFNLNSSLIFFKEIQVFRNQSIDNKQKEFIKDFVEEFSKELINHQGILNDQYYKATFYSMIQFLFKNGKANLHQFNLYINQQRYSGSFIYS